MEAIDYFNCAEVRLALNYLEGAMADYNKAIELKPDFAEAYNNRGNLKTKMNDLQGALIDFDKAIEYARQGLALDESRLFIQANLAAALLFKGEQEPAMAIYRKYKKELRDTFLDDFRQFEALGIIPQEAQQAVKTIKQFINQ